MTMTPRGEITAMQPSNDSAKAFLTALDNNAEGDTAARAAVEQMLRRPLLALPEKPVTANDTWSISSERPTAAGPLKIDTKYTLTSLSEQDGKPLANIGISATFTSTPGSQLTIKSPTHRGQIQFSIDQGRLLEVTQQQTLTTERPYRDTTIIVTLDSHQTTTMVTR